MNTKEMFFKLKSLVRQGSLCPAYARQIMQLHTGNENIPSGFAAWYANGWHYDRIVFGNKDAARPVTGKIRIKPIIAHNNKPYLP